MPIHERCLTCDKPLRTARHPHPEHADAVVHYARGRCRPCHERLQYSGNLKPVPPLIRPCVQCGRDTKPNSRPELPGAKRANKTHCVSCWRRNLRDAARGGPPRPKGRPHLHVVEDFTDLVEGLGGQRQPGTVIGWTLGTRERIAERLGMNRATLDTALYRARRNAA